MADKSEKLLARAELDYRDQSKQHQSVSPESSRGGAEGASGRGDVPV